MVFERGEARHDEVNRQLRHRVQTGYIVCDAGCQIPRSDAYGVKTWR
jgi:hypothetical protein